MSNGRPLFAFAFRAGLLQELSGFSEEQIVCPNAMRYLGAAASLQW